MVLSLDDFTVVPLGWSIPVVVRLVRALDGNTDVVGLLLGQFGEIRTELGEMQAGHAFIKMLGQGHHAGSIVLLGVVVELDLGQDLVGEGSTHHE